MVNEYPRSSNLIQQRLDREDYKHGWREDLSEIMITIGNGETCPYCEKIMENNKINNKPIVEHLFEEHGDKTLTKLFK